MAMADEGCSSPKTTPNASRTEPDPEEEKPNPNSSQAKSNTEPTPGNGENSPSLDNSTDSRTEAASADDSVKAAGESRNGVSDACSRRPGSFLRPSALSGGFTTLSSGFRSDSPPAEPSPSVTKCPLKSPKLNLAPSRLGSLDGSSSSGSGTKLPFQSLKSPFSSTVSFDKIKDESQASKNNVLQTEVNVSSASSGEKLSSALSSFSSSKSVANPNSMNTSILTTNFVFGQNLHERVVDGVATTNNLEKNAPEAAIGNGTSDMLFSSVLSNENVQENPEKVKEPFSLIEDAARCQEARANKRKYEEVLVTTGEEDEDNILQVNVKLFAFDSSTWVERGRGVLRLNDKNCDGTVVSRIVIRTLGSLRVVLNTKIWSEMSLTRASDRSIRLTAMDPNGQLKIFLIQASPNDTGTLFRYLDSRLQRCKENREEPEKKKLQKAPEDVSKSEENET